MKRKYKIAIIGFGSIGKRHLINIDLVLKKREIDYSVDLIRRKTSVEIDKSIAKLVSNVFTEDVDIPNDYDVIFITNPTNLHFETIKKYSSKSKNMFIEKPVFDKVSVDLKDLNLNPEGVYYVACPLRYTEVIQYIKNEIDLSNIYSVRAICSSYLPDWRQGVDYRTTYSAHLEQGGGVSIDLIHEWDYMMYLFGKPKNVKNFHGKYSKLEINSDDLSIYIAEYEKMLAEVHLDYFGRKTLRELQIFTHCDTIVADILNSQVCFLNEKKTIQFNEERNSFQIKEIENFFDIIEERKDNENCIATALATLKIAKEKKI